MLTINRSCKTKQIEIHQSDFINVTSSTHWAKPTTVIDCGAKQDHWLSLELFLHLSITCEQICLHVIERCNMLSKLWGLSKSGFCGHWLLPRISIEVLPHTTKKHKVYHIHTYMYKDVSVIIFWNAKRKKTSWRGKCKVSKY